MKYIFANWKANGTSKLCKQFVKQINNVTCENKFILCPPSVFLTEFKRVKNNNFCLGAQDCSRKNEGAFTGEISYKMLEELQVKYVIIGHSERRKYFNESDGNILEKIKNAVQNNITPVLCVGDNIEKEISILRDIKFEGFIAYEPLWAIGSGQSDTVENCVKIKYQIEKKLNYKIKFLYGGSVNLNNYSAFLNCKEIDGVLIGKASLNKNILEMCK